MADVVSRVSGEICKKSDIIYRESRRAGLRLLASVVGLALKGLGHFLHRVYFATYHGRWSKRVSHVHERARPLPLGCLPGVPAGEGKNSGVFSIPAPFDSSASVRGPHCFRV